jgi:hypothetical protein
MEAEFDEDTQAVFIKVFHWPMSTTSTYLCEEIWRTSLREL